MARVDCPRCGMQAVTVVRKLFMGPVLPAKCRACGTAVRVTFTASLAAALPVLAALAGSVFIESGALTVLVWIAGAAAVAFIHIHWVPLHQAD